MAKYQVFLTCVLNMPTTASLICHLCGSSNLLHSYSESWRGTLYSGYYCSVCDLYQTLGDIASVSPEYASLSPADLTDEHINLQTSHKHSAFDQWQALMEQHGGRKLSGNLLDIGCGVGGFLDRASELGISVFGYDASDTQAFKARVRHPNVANAIDIDQYVAGLAAATQFDYVTMWDVLEHIREPALLLAGIRRHLAPGGLLFVSVPGGGAIPMKLLVASALSREPGLAPWEHVFYYTPRSLKKLLAMNELKALSVGGVVAYPRPLGVHEFVRRIFFLLLRRSNRALQVFAVAR